MTAQLINGKDLSQQIRKNIKEKASQLTEKLTDSISITSAHYLADFRV